MNVQRNQRLEQGAATRATLVVAARKLFAERGYHGTGTEDVVTFAGVTRGALYYHFRDKEALFEAVFRELAGELFDAASQQVRPLKDRWRQMQTGLQVHLRLIAQSRESQRILLVDGPAVFGWAKWRELQSEFSLGALEVSIGDLIEGGVIQSHQPLVVAQMVLSALNEAALLIAHAPDPEVALAGIGETLAAMVSGLR
jgi:AcrR family transcriptional regulator